MKTLQTILAFFAIIGTIYILYKLGGWTIPLVNNNTRSP